MHLLESTDMSGMLCVKKRKPYLHSPGCSHWPLMGWQPDLQTAVYCLKNIKQEGENKEKCYFRKTCWNSNSLANRVLDLFRLLSYRFTSVEYQFFFLSNSRQPHQAIRLFHYNIFTGFGQMRMISNLVKNKLALNKVIVEMRVCGNSKTRIRRIRI